ncbi:MAG: urease accessory protein UreD [Acetobacteraceae bacterium]
MHQRSRGSLQLSFKRRGGDTVLDGLRQEGCLKARFPRPQDDGWAGAVTLNSSGGVAGGDALATQVGAGPFTRATVASQAAERFYRALPGTEATVTTRLHVAEGAALEWLPQETILFDRCALRRRLDVDVDADGWFLGVESLVFGRAAMGETVQSAGISDLIEVRRAGRRLLHDRVRFAGPVTPLLARAAVAGGAGAVASLVHVGAAAEARLDAVRAALAPFAAGASAWDGMLVARIVARNGACLRKAVVAGLAVLRDGRPLPRVWLC